MKSKLSGLLFALASVVIWSTHSSLIKSIVDDGEITLWTLLWLRPFLGFLFLCAVMKIVRYQMASTLVLKTMLTGFFLSLNFVSFQAGVIFSPTSSASMIIEAGATPIVLLYELLRGKRHSRLVFLSLVVVAVGVTIGLLSLITNNITPIALAICLFCPISWAGYIISSSRMSLSDNSLTGANLIKEKIGITAALLLNVSFFTLPFLVWGLIQLPPKIEIMRYALDYRLIHVCFLATGVAYLCFTLAVDSKLGAGGTSLVFSFAGIGTVLAGRLIISDPNDPVFLLSAALIGLGNIFYASGTKQKNEVS